MAVKTNSQQQVAINTTDEMSRGRYSNSMFITHGPEEFIIDWFLQSPNGPHLVSRVIVTPAHMKRIVNALKENLDIYENTFGEIKIINPSPNPIVQ